MAVTVASPMKQKRISVLNCRVVLSIGRHGASDEMDRIDNLVRRTYRLTESTQAILCCIYWLVRLPLRVAPMRSHSDLIMQSLTKGRRKVAIVALLAMLPTMTLAQPVSALQPSPETMHGSASRGEALFIGRTRFQNRAPACISCHSVAGLSFPNGGTLGPDLTPVYEEFGEQGTQYAMQTLFFPAMVPIYSAHPLVPKEQADLVAFLKQAQAKPQSHWTTQILILVAFLLGGVFVALTGFLWRNRVRSVRRALIDRATKQGVRL